MQIYKIIGLFLISGFVFLGFSAKALAETAYMNAYAKAYEEYTRRIDEAQKAGKPLSVEERKALGKELSSQVQHAFVQESDSVFNKLSRTATAAVRSARDELGLSGTSGPSSDLAKSKDANRSIAKASAKSSATNNARFSNTIGTDGVDPGTAENVSFTSTGATNSILKPKAPDEGGAEEVKFSK